MLTTDPVSGSTILKEWGSAVYNDLVAINSDWQSWSPTLTNLTLGSGGTVIAYYREVGKSVDFYFDFTFGTGSAVGTDPSFSLPVPVSGMYPVGNSSSFPGFSVLLDASVNWKQAMMQLTSTTVVKFFYWNSVGSAQQITATVPHTWNAGDKFIASGTYRRA